MNNRNSILFVTHKLNVGGAAKMMKYAADVARESFDIVKMLAINDESRGLDISDNIRVITMGIKPKPRILWQIRAILELRKQLKNDDSLYVCTFVTQVAFITKIASLGLNKIIISAERGDPYTMTFLWKIIAKWLYKHSHFALFQ